MVAFVASTVLTAANLNSAFNALTIRTVTLTSDTLVLADNGGAVTYSNASATTATVPPNSSVAYAVGTKIILANLGAGTVTVTAGSGVTVNGTLTIAQNAGGTCLKTATNTWSFLPFGSGAPTLTSADVTSTTGSPTITTSGANTIYSFTGSGTITFGKDGLLTNVLVVAGGGGGIGVSGGGGAGGGVLNISSAFISAGANTVIVGAGGAITAGQTQLGSSGQSSRLGPYYGVGGGPTFDRFPLAGTSGGSGGGGSYGSATYTGGTGTSGQGNNGGGGAATSAGGGGGSGAVGATGTGTTGGAGGAGSNLSATYGTIGGASGVFGGGGGGSGSVTAGAGGSGGGGAGSHSGNGTAGLANTGGGGGGTDNGGSIGGGGGSGLVSVKVPT